MSAPPRTRASTTCRPRRIRGRRTRRQLRHRPRHSRLQLAGQLEPQQQRQTRPRQREDRHLIDLEVSRRHRVGPRAGDLRVEVADCPPGKRRAGESAAASTPRGTPPDPRRDRGCSRPDARRRDQPHRRGRHVQRRVRAHALGRHHRHHLPWARGCDRARTRRCIRRRGERARAGCVPRACPSSIRAPRSGPVAIDSLHAQLCALVAVGDQARVADADRQAGGCAAGDVQLFAGPDRAQARRR